MTSEIALEWNWTAFEPMEGLGKFIITNTLNVPII
jgi:hypothetical protein